MFTSIYILEFSLLIFACLLSVFLLVTFKKVQKIETQKLAVIFNELQKEQEIATSYQHIPEKIVHLEKTLQQKLQIIKVKIITIDVALCEIFNV